METQIQVDYDKVFQLFIDKDKPKMEKPFKQIGHYIATDACALIMLPEDKAILPYEQDDRLECERVIPKNRNCILDLNVKSISEHLSEHLVNVTVFSHTCTKCKGEGVLECDLGHEHDCGNCSGEGSFYKPSGEKEGVYYKYYIIDDVVFTHTQVHRLIRACELMGLETITKTYGELNGANVFQCGDAIIVVMPVFDIPADLATNYRK